jgi:putative 4-mercaptohistidine N1-methyltranferase
MPDNYYDSQRAAAEYLLLHYGDPEPWGRPFPARCVTGCLAVALLPGRARALDLGCAVGGGTFELARHCAQVIGIDTSKPFIALARRLRERGCCGFKFCVEGELMRTGRAVVPREIDRKRARFEVGDAANLRGDLGMFDVVMMANLIDRVPAPRRLLVQLPGLVKRGGQLIITSPYTWLVQYTPRAQWLGGFERGGRRVQTFATLKGILSPYFKLSQRRNIPFLIREHTRKYQLGVAEAGVWLRR